MKLSDLIIKINFVPLLKLLLIKKQRAKLHEQYWKVRKLLKL